MTINDFDEQLLTADTLGRPNIAPGVYRGMPERYYHASSALSQSDIKAFLDNSRAFLKTRTDEGVRRKIKTLMEPERDTEAKRIGTYTHLALLEPERWKAYKPAPPGMAFNKRDSAFRMFFQAAQGKVVRYKEYQIIEAISREVAKHDDFSTCLVDAEKELSIFWVDSETNLRLKARLDIYHEDTGLVIDPKTIAPEYASVDGFAQQVCKLGYHIQRQMYMQALEAHAMPAKDFLFLVIEKDDLYPGTFFARIMPGMQQEANKDIRQGLRAYERMTREGLVVPEISRAIAKIDVPTFSKYEGTEVLL